MQSKRRQHGILNVGVVGMGGRGRYLAKCFAERPSLALKAVCDMDPQALKTCRRLFGDQVAYYRNLEDMCARENLQIGVAIAIAAAESTETNAPVTISPCPL